jgi:hypothetical protein
MAFEICLISNSMFPIASLPNAFFPLADFACRTRLRIEASRKAALDGAPASGEVCIAFRQYPNGMNMIRQNADRDGLKRMPLLNDFIDVPEAVDFVDQKAVGPLREDDREKENAAIGTNILRHDVPYRNRT